MEKDYLNCQAFSVNQQKRSTTLENLIILKWTYANFSTIFFIWDKYPCMIHNSFFLPISSFQLFSWACARNILALTTLRPFLKAKFLQIG